MSGNTPEIVNAIGTDPDVAILNTSWFEEVYDGLMAELLAQNASRERPYTFEDVINWLDFYRSGIEDAADVLRDVSSLPMHDLTDREPETLQPGLITLCVGQKRFAPAFQFDSEGMIRPEVLDINLRLYGNTTIWGATDWWITPIEELDELSPLHILELAPENLDATYEFLPLLED